MIKPEPKMCSQRPVLISRDKNEHLVLRLPYRPPFEWNLLLEFLKYRAIAGVESVTENCYARTVSLGSTEDWIEVRTCTQTPHLEVRVGSSSTENLTEISVRIGRIFDLEADPLIISNHLRRDKKLRPVVEAFPGLRVPGAWDGFELAVRAVLGQMVSVKVATTLAGRLVTKYGYPGSFARLPGMPGLTHLFPTATTLAQARLGDVGISRARADTLRMLAMKVCSGELVLDGSRDANQTIRCLLDIPGIGPWTAQYIALRALHDPDAFPSSDLVIKRVLAKFNAGSKKEILNCHSEMWRPWRAYAVIYLWRMESEHAKKYRGDSAKRDVSSKHSRRGREERL